MRETLNGLAKDVGAMFKCSTAGDQAFLESLEDKVLLVVLDKALDCLLTSSEERSENCWSSNAPEVLTHRQKGSFTNLFKTVRRLVWGPSGELAFPDKTAFAALYQLFSLLTKYGAGEMKPDMVVDAVDLYKSIEANMTDPIMSSAVETYARVEISRVLSYAQDFRGRHGPGAVAEGGLPSGEKYQWSSCDDLEPGAYASLREYYSLETPPYGTCGSKLIDPRCSKWHAVPKSTTKVRGICAEPALLQYMQQGLGKSVAFACAVAPNCGADVRLQSVNANLAREASGHGYYCTLDLSSASDRLSMSLVERLLPPEWFAVLSGCRSYRTTLPNGEVLDLKKYGSMGNATTFPVQSLIYWALLVALLRSDGCAIDESRSNVYVYGDDIILPSKYAGSAIALLNAVGLKVNRRKSFVNGSFRESCGVHAYHGMLVTPAYLRTTSTTGPGLVSMCACANALKEGGYDCAADTLYRKIESRLGTRLPTVGESLYGPRNVQLAILDRYADIHTLVHVNESKGIRVRLSRNHHLTVKAFGLYELKSKRIGNPFACMGDIWDYTHGVGSVSDRGYIPGPVALSLRDLTLR